MDDQDKGRALSISDTKSSLPPRRKNESSALTEGYASIMAAATDPNVDASKMAALVDLQIKMMDYTKQEEFNKDKIAAIMEMPVIRKDGAILDKNNNVRSRFSTFEHLYTVVKPILSRHNLALTFATDTSEKQPTVTPILSHANGFVERGGAMLVPIEKPNQSVTMGMAAAMSVTMGKRHTLKATLGIIEDGDDGAAPRVQYIEREDWQNEVISDGQHAALKGPHAYAEWFQSLTNMRRGFLVDSGEHANLKESATLLKKDDDQ